MVLGVVTASDLLGYIATREEQVGRSLSDNVSLWTLAGQQEGQMEKVTADINIKYKDKSYECVE